MISREQFQLQVDRLADTFGDKNFPEQRTHMIWEMMRGLDYTSVIAVVDSFIRGSKFAPLPSDFHEALTEIPGQKKYKLGDVHPIETSQCLDCRDSGFIRLVRKPEFEKWARYWSGSAPCHCHRGKELIEAGSRRPREPIDFGPQFGEHWKTSYEILEYM